MAVLETSACPAPTEADWFELYEYLRPRAFGVLLHYGIPDQDAEDVLHDTLLLFLVKRPPMEDATRWVLGTLKRRCGMYWRARGRRLHSTIEPTVLETLAKPVPPEQDRAMSRYDLERVLSRVPEHRRRALEATYLEDRTPTETAKLLGYRRSGIYKVLDRSLKRAAREMEALGQPAKGS